MKNLSILLLYCIGWADGFPYARPPPESRKFVSQAIEDVITQTKTMLINANLPDSAAMFENTYPNTLDTTVAWWNKDTNNPRTFVITGDIPAMWIRDSMNQVRYYIPSIDKDDQLKALLLGVILQQADFLSYYPWANAFKAPPESGIVSGDNSWSTKDHANPPFDENVVWEAKYEIDSWAAFLQLSGEFYTKTQDASAFTKGNWTAAVDAIVKSMRVMQLSTEDSYNSPGYTFTRDTNTPTETCANGGRGNPRLFTGMVASLFRPSDDSCILPYFVPGNAMAAVGLEMVIPILTAMGGQDALLAEVTDIAAQIRTGIETYGLVQVTHSADNGTSTVTSTMYAFEVDGYGGAIIMDDGNIPSLLSLPELGYCDETNDNYTKTRDLIISKASDPYFFSGSQATGIGSPHSGWHRPWMMGVAMQALTDTSSTTRLELLAELTAMTAGTGLMHESVEQEHTDDYTRQWFAWANAVYGHLVFTMQDLGDFDAPAVKGAVVAATSPSSVKSPEVPVVDTTESAVHVAANATVSEDAVSEDVAGESDVTKKHFKAFNFRRVKNQVYPSQ